LAIKVHGGLEAQGVTGAETTGCYAFLEKLGPESLTVFCCEQQFNAIFTGIASAGSEDGIAQALELKVSVTEAGQAAEIFSTELFEQGAKETNPHLFFFQ
jgi:hypothetical protein